MPPKATAASVAEGVKAADYWMAVAPEPHADVSKHINIKSLKVRGPNRIH